MNCFASSPENPVCNILVVFGLKNSDEQERRYLLLGALNGTAWNMTEWNATEWGAEIFMHTPSDEQGASDAATPSMLRGGS